MRLEDFPRPKDDNRRGVHWSASVYHPRGSALDFWISELRAMRIKWVKLMDDSGGSSLELCQRLLAADIMPIVRLYRPEPNPGHIGGREEDTIRRLVAVGVRYFETNNEPDLPVEWKENSVPKNWMDVVIDNFIIDADKVLGLGGLPAVPAMGVGSRDNPIAEIVKKGRADLFQKGTWVAIHNYTLNHPLDYPYDRVNQEGTPVSQEEYDAAGSWGWEARPREMINEWRATDKNPGDTLEDDANCFLAFYLMDQMIVKALGYQVPIISTEGGPVVGWKEDRRYPRIDPRMHAASVVAINEFMQGERLLNGIRCPASYFTICHWLLANYRLGFLSPGWESQSWYTDWWNTDFNLQGQLPVVAAVKSMTAQPVPGIGTGIIKGQLLRADSGTPLGGLEVKLLSGDRAVANAISAADGTFLFDRLASGGYQLSVSPWGVVRRDVKVGTEPTPPVIIRLVGGRSSTLSGQLLDHQGKPRAGARVSLRKGAATVSEKPTGADGSFSFTGLPLGSYQLRTPGITVSGIALDGWGGKSLKLTEGTPSGYRYAVSKQRLLPADETGGRTIFYGTVTDAAGRPLNGVALQMSWKGAEPGTDFPVKQTGHDPHRPAGRYEFTHTQGTFSLEVVQGDWPSSVAEDLETARVPGREGQPIAYEVSFQLQLAGSPTRVEGIMPGALAGAPVRLVGAAQTLETRLGTDMSFVFSNLPEGAYRLEMPGVGILTNDIQLGPGALYRILFPLRSRLSGQVLQAPAGAIAVLYAPASFGWTRQMPLDAAGKFAFERLPAGSYRLEVADAVLQGLELTGENTLALSPIDLTQGRRSVVRGRVADAAGKPQANVMVILRRSNSVVANTPTEADGAFKFVNLAAGTYALEVVGMGEVAAGIALNGQNEAVRNIVWRRASPRGVIRGRVLTPGGAPQVNLAVRLRRRGAQLALTRTDRTGGFRFPGLAADSYEVSAGDSRPTVTPVKLAEGATVTLTVRYTVPPKPKKRYVLLSLPTVSPDDPGGRRQVEQSLMTAMHYLQESGSAGGFDVEEAVQAEHVVLVGESLADSVEMTLRAAGCRISRLPDDPERLARALAAIPDD